MIETTEKNIYKAFGLTISSTIHLPELTQINNKDRLTDIVIKKEDLTVTWAKQFVTNEHYVINENSVIFQVPHVATYLIRNGNEILFSPLEGSQENEIRIYILGTCMGAVLLQRKILPLHGSAVAIDGKAYAIVGDSGVGKSTLASAFLNNGYRLLSDDVIPVSLNKENIPVVAPAYPQQKLWLESLNQFGMVSSNYQPLVDRDTKFAIPVHSQFANESLPLAGVIELVKTEADEVEMYPIQKMERFLVLFNHTYRNLFIEPSELIDWHFNTSAKMVKHIDLYRLHRPVSYFTAHELTDIIINTLKKKENVYVKN
ncbi:aldolase [Peribacillus sp. NPDC096379]|uniref:aldolase n=1 Tax=Peribacillus sp. NPDC096379 TaxID=3364393 RepID=UPI00382E8CD6